MKSLAREVRPPSVQKLYNEDLYFARGLIVFPEILL